MKLTTEQFNLRLERKTLDRLEELALRYNKRSKAAVAAEIIEMYVDFWSEVEQAKAAIYVAQKSQAAPQRVNSSDVPDMPKRKVK